MDISKLGRKELEERFRSAKEPSSPLDVEGEWSGIFLPFRRVFGLPEPILKLVDISVKNTWGRLWLGKKISKEGESIKGLNILRLGIKTLPFRVKLINSRLDGKPAVEFDYSDNPPPFCFIKDEVRIADDEKNELLGLMFFEVSRLATPVVFFGLERK